MSVAALEAVTLGDTVADGAQDVGRRFFRAAARIVDTPWTIAVGNDLRMPETVGPRHPMTALINGYMAQLRRAAQRDPVLARTFMGVASLMAPPSAVLHPRIAWRVLRDRVRWVVTGRHLALRTPRVGETAPLGEWPGLARNRSALPTRIE